MTATEPWPASTKVTAPAAWPVREGEGSASALPADRYGEPGRRDEVGQLDALGERRRRRRGGVDQDRARSVPGSRRRGGSRAAWANRSVGMPVGVAEPWIAGGTVVRSTVSIAPLAAGGGADRLGDEQLGRDLADVVGSAGEQDVARGDGRRLVGQHHQAVAGRGGAWSARG